MKMNLDGSSTVIVLDFGTIPQLTMDDLIADGEPLGEVWWSVPLAVITKICIDAKLKLGNASLSHCGSDFPH